MGSVIKILSDTRILLVILAIIMVIIGLICYVIKPKNTEGFNAVTQERIDYQNKSKRMYNDYSNMIPLTKVPVIPRGEAGDPYLVKLLRSPHYEGSADSGTKAALNYNYEFPYLSPPENSALMAKIMKCESVKEWNCNAFNDPDFAKYCGICTKDGETHTGKSHVGGLYIDPYITEQLTKEAAASGKPPNYSPSAGICKGEFLIGRPYCDVQKDRNDCSKVLDFKSPDAVKCALCADSPDGKFVYIGSRGSSESNYALKAKPVTFTARLRLAVTHPNEAAIIIKNKATNAVISGSFITGTNTYICDLSNVKENDVISISIKYPEYSDHVFTSEDLGRINNLTKPKKATLTKAMYGPIDEDRFESIEKYGPQAMRDDPRAIDVTQQFQTNYNMKECSKAKIDVDVYKLGGNDPSPYIQKGLRLDFALDDPNNTITRYVAEANPESWTSRNWDSMCPDSISQVDAETQICETALDGTPLTNRTYTNGKNTSYYGASKSAKCVEQNKKIPRGLVGIWESIGAVKRTVPLSKSVRRINGFDVGSVGVPIHGTVKNSKYFKNIVSLSKVIGIPTQLFWFWAKDETTQSCEFSVVVPATLRDPSQSDDIKLCPSGPLITTVEGSKRLAAGPCEMPNNGKPQGPGNYSMACVQSLFLNSGCVKEGRAYPNSPEKLEALLKDPKTGDNNDIDAIDNIVDEMYSISKTSKNLSGLQVDDTTLGDVSMKCMGKLVNNPCDIPNKQNGPLTVSCLNYLYRNAGKTNEKIGQTYPGSTNRSSGTGRTDKTPVLFCQTAGTMSPIGSDGKINSDAVEMANSYGGVNEVREFYRQIHSDANYSSDPVKQRLALSQCYGVGVSTKQSPPKGTSARYVRVMPSKLVNDPCIQIAQLSVYDVNDQNVSVGKPVKSTPGFQIATANNAVDGVERTRPFSGIYHSMCEPTNWWEVDLKSTQEISYIVYYNRAESDPASSANYRSNGMRVQLLDENRIVIKEKTLTGLATETLLFSNVKPSGLLKENTVISLLPHKSPGGAVTIDAGGEILVKTRSASESNNNTFIVQKGLIPGTFMFKHKNSEKYLRVQGFRIRASENDNTEIFKQEIAFKVVDSLSANPSEISLESAYKQGSYLALADNKGVYISPATTFKQQQACSWRVLSS